MRRMISILVMSVMMLTVGAGLESPIDGEAVTQPTASPKATATPKPSMQNSSKAKKQKVIVIDAGHQTHAMSATEPIGPGASQKKAKVTGGATGCVTHLPEYKLNLQVAKKLKKELVKRGYKVVMVRTKNNVKLSNVDRAKMANKNNADAFIRIHANSSASSSVRERSP